MRKLAWLVILAALIPGIAGALGIGGLKLGSALNEPFSARIELTGVSGDELDGIQVGLASPEAFARAGIERPYFLTKLRFRVVREADGKAYIRITTDEPVKEPFLHFLLELNWPKGRLLREYTVLLDPPLYEPESPVLSVGVPEGVVGGTPVKSGHVVQHFESRRPAPAPAPAARPAPRGGTGHMTGDGILVGEHDTLWSIASHNLPDSSVSVQQMMLALLRANPEAFLADNVNTLKAGYILRLPSAGEVRAIDRRQALEMIRRHNAEWQQYRQQIAAGTGLRTEGAAGSRAGGAGVAAAGEAEARLELVSPRQESAAGAEAVAGAAGGTGGGSVMGEEVAVAAERMASAEAEMGELRRQLQQSEEVIELLRRKIELRDQELAALQAKLAELGQELPPKLAAEAGQMPAGEPLETGVGGTPVPVEHVVQTFEMPSSQPAAGQEAEAAAGEQAPAAVQEQPAGAEQPAPAATPAAEQPEAPRAGRTVFGYPLPGWLNDILDPAVGMLELLLPASALALIPGGGLTVLGIVALLLLLILVLLLRALLRPKQVGVQLPPSVSRKEKPAEEEAVTEIAGEAVTEVPEAEAEAAPTTIEAAQEAGLTEQTVPGADAAASTVAEEAAEVEPEEDPLAEVNVYLAYERFDQAEELVKKVIAEHPDEPKYRLRLLEVYYSANDKKAYEEAARELYEAVNGEGELWDSAVAMWNEMSPTRALFEEGGEEEPGAAAAGAAAGVSMLDLSGEAGEEEFPREDTVTVAPGETTGEEEGLDIDLAAPEEEVTAPAEATEGGAEEEGFLDLTAPEEAQSAEEILDLTAAAETEAGGDVLDITAESEEQETELLDLTGGESAGSDLLDLTAGGESGEDLLDLAGGEGLPGEGDILDVTAGGGIEEVEAEDLLDVTNIAPPPGAAEEETEAPTEEAGENLVEFDLGGTGEETAAPAESEAPEAGEVEGGLEFDISDLTVETAEEQPQAEAGEETDEALDFSLDLGEETGAGQEVSTEESAAGEAPEATETPDEALDFSLDLGEEPLAGMEPAESGETAGEETAAGEGEALDFSLDLDTGATAEEEGPGAGLDFEATTTEAPGGEEAAVSGTEESVDFDLGLEEETSSAPAGLEMETPAGESAEAGEEMLDLTLEGEDQGPEAELGESLEELAQSLEEVETGGEGAGEEFGGLDLEIEGEEEPLVEGLEAESLETMRLEPETPAPEEMEDKTVVMPRGDEVEEQSEEDEIDTKLNLAKAYIELGDNEGARTILEEVRQGGSEEQVRQAEELLKQVE